MIPRYPGCFVCGHENHSGLQAEFFLEGEKAVTEVIAKEQFEGFKSIYHGGILATLLDEVMLKAILARGIFAVTAEMTVRYHKPVTTGDQIRFQGWITKKKGRVYWTEGEALSVSGERLASAVAIFMEGDSHLQTRLTQSVE